MRFEITYYEILDSTNSFLQRLLATKSPKEGTVIWADHQTEGRGQRGRVWEAPPALGLSFSVLLKPEKLSFERSFDLSVALALGVRDGLLPWSPTAIIKWPNDILVGQDKLAGILIELQWLGRQAQNAIIGIGININQSHETGLVDKATSLFLATGQQYDREEVLKSVLAAIDKRYTSLLAGETALLRADYEAILYGKDAIKNFQTPEGQRFMGMIEGIETDGRIRIKDENTGAIKRFAVGEVYTSRS
jgi:BirA family transcriptional regulator, biotin operon repressor / biotin---[acetyl-CoA-carboxylase] ligase